VIALHGRPLASAPIECAELGQALRDLSGNRSLIAGFMTTILPGRDTSIESVLLQLTHSISTNPPVVVGTRKALLPQCGHLTCMALDHGQEKWMLSGVTLRNC
jgi:hypothetical protein